MAILSADKTYVTVERGDCLWNIAKKYLGSGTKYKQLATLNGISNANYIYPGQKIKLTGTASSSSSTTAKNSNKATITMFGLMASADDDTLFAVWTWGKSHTDKYEYEWEYTIKDTKGTWWTGVKTSTKDTECTWVIPKNAEKIRFRVKPVAENKPQSSSSGSTSSDKLYDESYWTSSSSTTTSSSAKPYWTAEWTNFNGDGAYKPYSTDSLPPLPPPIPSVRLSDTDKFTLISEIDNIDAEELHATGVKFQIVKNNSSEYASSVVTIDKEYKYVSYTRKVDAGGEYKVRCKSYRGNLESAWSDYSSVVATAPSKPSGFKTCRAKSSSIDGKISVYLSWDQVPAAKTYDIEYATNRNYFDGSDQTQTISNITLTNYETYSLEAGNEYFFRLRAVNDGGESDWSDISDGVALGEPPVAPTTWSSTTTATVGGPLTLYWVHNAKDGSSQTWASLGLEIYTANGLDENGNTNYQLQWNKEIEIKNTEDIEERDKTSSFDATAYLADQIPSLYKDGVQLRWRVRTAGVTDEFGEWSVVRMIDIYAEPSVTLTVRDATNTINTTFDTVGSLPIYISTSTQPPTQAPIGFHLSVVSNDAYETVDNVGNDKMVSAGEVIYSRYIDQGTDLSDFVLSAGDIDLESSVNYTLTCVVAMNSGLTAETSLNFVVSWEEVSYVPNATISYDPDLIVTHIHPYCERYTSTYFGVEYDSKTDVYTATETEVTAVGIEPLVRMYMANGTEVFSEYVEDGETIYYYENRYGKRVEIEESLITRKEQVYTSTGERVCSGLTEFTIDEQGNISGGDEITLCEIQTGTPVDGVLLSVYRREFDGSYTELGKDIDNTKNTYVTDPHPALDYARYRIVATTQSTGAISYYDMPGFPIGEKAIIIQWSEDWTNFDVAGDDPQSQPPWSGSLLRLPYNIDVSDDYGMDVSLVEYAGRKRPVSYYGTQLGETSSWNTVIPKDDEETLYALRRLAIWTGDAYVREPSGTGYWANVAVSFNQKHLDVTIPVTLKIKRVEGGA